MQKKLIALAVASLVSGAAFAQVAPNNVTLSGIVDMGYRYSWDSNTGAPSQHAFNDGFQDGSRVKLDGTEDLGNGLKVGFHTDFRFSVDTQSAVTTDNQNLFLTGGFGTVTAGSFGDALDDNNGLSEAGSMGFANGVVSQFKGSGAMKNGFKYNSPNMSGFDAMVGVSTQNQKIGELQDGNQRALQARVTYVNGPIKAGLAARRDKVQSTDASRTEWLLNGSYNFGPVMLGAGYVRSKWSDDGVANALVGNGGLEKRTAWRLNVGAPIGANDYVGLSYSHAKDTTAAGSFKESGWGLSYNHNLSKRTNFYASYGKGNQDVTLNDSYQQALAVGVRHQF
jgi:predicted porin